MISHNSFEIFSEAQKELIEQFLITNESFSQKAKILGLNPATDFIDSDLRNIDFSNSNLNGYNFSGADLRGANGINIQFDSTTIFTNALLDYSVFSFPNRREKMLQNSRLRSRYEALMKLDSIERSNFLLSELEHQDSRDLAKLIIHDDQQSMTQNTALYALADIISDEKELLEQIKSMLNIRGQNQSYVTLLIRIIRKKFWNIKQIQSTILPLVNDARTEVAIRAILCFKNSSSEIQTYIKEATKQAPWLTHRKFLTLGNGINNIPARLQNIRKYPDRTVFSFKRDFLDPKKTYSKADLDSISIVDTVDIGALTDDAFEVVIRSNLDNVRYRARADEKLFKEQKRSYEARIERYTSWINSKEALTNYFREVLDKSNIRYKVPTDYKIRSSSYYSVAPSFGSIIGQRVGALESVNEKIKSGNRTLKLPDYCQFQ